MSTIFVDLEVFQLWSYIKWKINVFMFQVSVIKIILLTIMIF